MVLGNMMNQSGQQYVAIKDDKNTWRVLDTWHADLKMLSADDDIPDDSPAVVALSEGQFIALNDFEPFINMSATGSLFINLLFLVVIFTFIFFRISIIPVLEGLTLTFLIKIFEFFDNAVKTIKKAAELISPGI